MADRSVCQVALQMPAFSSTKMADEEMDMVVNNCLNLNTIINVRRQNT